MFADPEDEVIGLERGVVRLVAYQASWAEAFAREAERLRAALGERIGAVEHMGSTAIPGMAAKPIIDMMAAVRSLPEAEALAGALETLGYEWHPRDMDDVPERRYFVRRDSLGRSTHHLSLATLASGFWGRQLLFRDYLRAHPDARDAYAKRKGELAKQHRTDRPAYVDSKTEFVREILARAREATPTTANETREED